MPDQDLEEMMQRAARNGATEALQRLGLTDDDAPRDMSELRGMLSAWRTARSELYKTTIHWLTIVGLTAIAAILGIRYFGVKIGSN